MEQPYHTDTLIQTKAWIIEESNLLLIIIVTQLSLPMFVKAQTEAIFGRVHGVTSVSPIAQRQDKMDEQNPTTRYSNALYSTMDTFTSFSSNTLTHTPSLIILTRRSVPTSRHTQIFLPQHHRYHRICCSSSDGSNAATDDDSGTPQPNSVQPPTVSPPGAVRVRFRRRSRRQSRQEREGGDASSASSMQFNKAKASASETSPKKWEDMSIPEKAVELYMGEKGMLFWLNKFAYASIFIMIGAWIVFRFVGPALNLYQLDSAPLAPTSLLKGS